VASSARGSSGREGAYAKGKARGGGKAKPPTKLKPMKHNMTVREVFAQGSQQQQAGLVVAVARNRHMRAEELAEVLDAASATVGAVEGLEHARTFAAHKLYFSGMRTLLNHPVQLQQLLLSLHEKLTAAQGEEGPLGWHEGDRQLFVGQFASLGIVQQYLGVHTQLGGLGVQGNVALGRIERDLLLKVVQDFAVQVNRRWMSNIIRLRVGHPLGVCYVGKPVHQRLQGDENCFFFAA